MQPEISRRCLVCGASVRAGAQFCSQCGHRLGERGGARAESSEVSADARAGEGQKGDAAGKGEVERAFEAWRGGEHVAAEEARRARGAEPAAGDNAHPSATDEAARPSAAGGNAHPPVVESSEPPPSRGATMPEPRATEEPQSSVEEEAAPEVKRSGAVGATRRRAASVVKESIAPRVERVRDRSIVMLEEAPDDSGLRFVLIAVVLFALFIFLLVLNTVIK